MQFFDPLHVSRQEKTWQPRERGESGQKAGMSVERLLPQMLMSTAAILVGILLVLMGLLRIGRSIKFHHHHRISLQRCRDHRQRPAGGILPPIRLGPVADICITEGLPGSAGEP